MDHFTLYIPEIACDSFLEPSNKWSKRVKGKSWSNPDVLSAVSASGFQLVPKTSKKPGSDPPTSFRLAFNVAEKLLAESLTPFQRECFRVFKMYYYEKLKTKGINNISSKNGVFWALETSVTNIWHEENRAYCCMLLLQYLRMSLAKTTLQHYFIPGNNLFEYLDMNELNKILEALLLQVVKEFKKHQKLYSSSLNGPTYLKDRDLLDTF